MTDHMTIDPELRAEIQPFLETLGTAEQRNAMTGVWAQAAAIAEMIGIDALDFPILLAFHCGYFNGAQKDCNQEEIFNIHQLCITALWYGMQAGGTPVDGYEAWTAKQKREGLN